MCTKLKGPPLREGPNKELKQHCMLGIATGVHGLGLGGRGGEAVMEWLRWQGWGSRGGVAEVAGAG